MTDVTYMFSSRRRNGSGREGGFAVGAGSVTNQSANVRSKAAGLAQDRGYVD